MAASGFFDGILLHQVLQWHHLLSSLDTPAWADIERQILADGVFHAAMYLLAFLSLWLLWRHRHGFSDGLSERSLISDGLLGFGLWNVLDGVLSHWLLGLHRVRMDSAHPLAWDIGWLVLTGLLPMVLAWWLRGGSGSGGNEGDRGGTRGSFHPRKPRLTRKPGMQHVATARWFTLALFTFAAGAWSGWPGDDASVLMVYYPRGTPGSRIMGGVHAVQGRVIDMNADGTVWAISVPAAVSITPRATLLLHGATAMAAVPAWAGCAQSRRRL